MHFTHGHQTCQEIRFLLGIGLAGDTLVAFAGGAGLVGVDSGHQDQLVLNFLIHFGKTIDVITYGIFVIGGAGPDNHQKLIAFAGENVTDLCVSCFLDPD